MKTERYLQTIGDEMGPESARKAPEIKSPDVDGQLPRPTSEQEVVQAIRRNPADLLGDRLSPQRLAEIRHRLATGVYNTPAVALEVAMRMLQHGEF